MGELEAIKDEIIEVRKEVSDVRVDIAFMQPFVQQIPQISKALTVLAEVMPRLEANMEEHKRMHFRMDNLEGEQRRLHMEFTELNLEHAACMERIRLEEKAEPTKTSTLVRQAVIPILAAVVTSFALWLSGIHVKEYVDSKDDKSTSQNTQR